MYFVAIVTMSLRGLMMLPGGAQWGADAPFTWISVRYSSHFPLDTSLGQSNSTCRLPWWPSLFPLMCTYHRKWQVVTWFQQPLKVKRILTHLKCEDQQNPHIFHPLHGRLPSHMSTERGVAWLIDSVRTGWRSGVIRSEINNRADVTYSEREACRETITNMEMKTGFRSDCSLSLNTHGTHWIHIVWVRVCGCVWETERPTWTVEEQSENLWRLNWSQMVEIWPTPEPKSQDTHFRWHAAVHSTSVTWTFGTSWLLLNGFPSSQSRTASLAEHFTCSWESPWNTKQQGIDCGGTGPSRVQSFCGESQLMVQLL